MLDCDAASHPHSQHKHAFSDPYTTRLILIPPQIAMQLQRERFTTPHFLALLQMDYLFTRPATNKRTMIDRLRDDSIVIRSWYARLMQKDL